MSWFWEIEEIKESHADGLILGLAFGLLIGFGVFVFAIVLYAIFM